MATLSKEMMKTFSEVEKNQKLRQEYLDSPTIKRLFKVLSDISKSPELESRFTKELHTLKGNLPLLMIDNITVTSLLDKKVINQLDRCIQATEHTLAQLEPKITPEAIELAEKLDKITGQQTP